MKVKNESIWHLEHDYHNPVRDPLWNHIYLSDGLLALVESLPFQQLSKIKQLGPAYLVYPGATHTRLAHSLGVYHIAYRMIRTLLSFDSCPSLSKEFVAAYLAAALLHDLGHFPLTHSLKELPLEEHEALAGRMIQEEPLAGLIREKLRTDPRLVAQIIDETLETEGREEIGFFRTLLSGALDPDKLDYLNRDAYFCGVPYGMQDIDYALSRIRPYGAKGIALEQTGISAVENILFSKYLMYRAVYWHRNVRVATAMVKDGLYRALKGGYVEPSELYNLNDESFYNSFAAREGEPFELIRRVHNRQLYVPAADIAYDHDNEAHRKLTELDHRTATVERLCEAIASQAGTPVNPLHVMLDIPEAVSFEVNFPAIIGDHVVDYPESDTVFTPHVVADFTRTLRRVRLILEP
ncbi:MAG: HD domain-containing protein, partial [Spirochaetota bacterium]